MTINILYILTKIHVICNIETCRAEPKHMHEPAAAILVLGKCDSNCLYYLY